MGKRACCWRPLADIIPLATSSTILWGSFVIKSVLRISWSGFRIKLILEHPVVSALFASWFGYILWPIAYFRMSRGRSLKDPKHASQVVLCIILFIAGKSHIHRPTHDTVTANSRSRRAAGVFLFTATPVSSRSGTITLRGRSRGLLRAPILGFSLADRVSLSRFFEAR
jgi:hypothetical protein